MRKSVVNIKGVFVVKGNRKNMVVAVRRCVIMGNFLFYFILILEESYYTCLKLVTMILIN